MQMTDPFRVKRATQWYTQSAENRALVMEEWVTVFTSAWVNTTARFAEQKEKRE